MRDACGICNGPGAIWRTSPLATSAATSSDALGVCGGCADPIDGIATTDTCGSLTHVL